jgi:hypothetical protein
LCLSLVKNRWGQYNESDEWDASSVTLQYNEHVDTFYLCVTPKNPDYEVDGTESQEPKSPDDHGKNGMVLGVDLIPRLLTPHVTLARMDHAAAKTVVQRAVRERDPEVEELRLTESTLTADGPEYRTVERFGL